jgi:hypothetical protein
MRFIARRVATCVLASLLFAGCGASGVASTQRLPSKAVSELRDAIEQEALTCNGATVRKLNPRTLRRECVRRTPTELDAAIHKLLARCHGAPEQFNGMRFVKCVKRTGSQVLVR